MPIVCSALRSLFERVVFATSRCDRRRRRQLRKTKPARFSPSRVWRHPAAGRTDSCRRGITRLFFVCVRWRVFLTPTKPSELLVAVWWKCSTDCRQSTSFFRTREDLTTTRKSTDGTSRWRRWSFYANAHRLHDGATWRPLVPTLGR